MESAGKKPDELSNLKEIVYSMKQYAEERTETEILVEQIDKAKEKENKRPSEFSEIKLGEKLNYSKSTIHNLRTGEKELTEEIKKKLEKELNIHRVSLDKELDQANRGYLQYLRDTSPELSEAEIQTFDEREELMEEQRLESEAREQLEKIERWFRKLKLEGCCLLSHHMKDFKEIPDICWKFFMYYRRLDEGGRRAVRNKMQVINIPVSSVSKYAHWVASFGDMAYIKDEDIQDAISQDKTEIEDKNRNVEIALRKKYWENVKAELDYRIRPYCEIEEFYQRFWAYPEIKEDDWRAMGEFLLLEGIGEFSSKWPYEGITTYQSMILDEISAWLEKQPEEDSSSGHILVWDKKERCFLRKK